MSTPAFSLPSQMKSLLQPSRTSTSLILTNSPVPKPTHPDDVLVRVAAASPCAGELLWAINFPASVPTEKEMVPCQDLAGTVVTSPSNSGFVPGDRVYCRIDAARAGTAREYALARVSELAEIPKNLGWVEAAATPLSALTAWQALFVQGGLDARGVKQGEKEARERNGKIRVLVTGAAGGVGSWVVQFAKLAGAKGVVAVCGGDKESAARELGATEVVNYQKQSIEQWVGEKPEEREVDLVIDMIGGASLKGCWYAVKKGGVLVSVNTPPDMVKPEGLEKEVAKSLFFIVEPSGRNLAEIGELIEAGKVRPVVDSVWEFEEFEKAFERLESGHAKGKIIIKVSDEVTV
ncbi:Reticulon-4-interacting protein 1, mitochondrial [Rhypophila decipiens]|uniref:Reticulon-4-interacting protein 1, mitochondrial n=1 Tax=Rhypophila decipiens TaxID=261697 RepID=A0AAN7B5V2_9PEZI|nr:Reticulon-4-interacting protein 1, mitochondrial [Rhypophila decipiens]